MVNRHPRHIGLATNRLYGEAGIAIWGHEQFTSGAEDASARLFGGCLALTEAVRARTHRDLTSFHNLLYTLSIQILIG